MRYCIECGHVLEPRLLAGEASERQFCIACRAVRIQYPKVLIACLAHWQQQVVLCRRAIAPATGLWFPPTGFVELGETLQEAVIRELREETGASVSESSLHLYGVASLPHMNQIYVSFRAELEAEPNLTPGPESLEVRLFTEAEIPRADFAFSPMTSQLLPNFFRRLRMNDSDAFSVTLRPGLQAEKLS